ncbi:MAG: hypothetical protein CMJ46_04915, partial [Planctomyces sp.]|nr:hypothetical protein [Planctomyces sp.]
MLRIYLLIVIVAVTGCGSRGEVAKEKLLGKIDSILGEMDVKRKQIEVSVDAFKEGVDGLRKAKIKAQVQQDQITRKVTPLDGKINEIDTSLKKMKVHLAAGESAEFAGKTYSAQELKAMADKLLSARKELVTQKERYETSQASLQKVVDTLETKQSEYQERLSKLETQIAEIDGKTIALKAMKDASAAMGESEKSMAENVDALEEKINELYADVEVEMLNEDEKWNSESTTAELDAVVGG